MRKVLEDAAKHIKNIILPENTKEYGAKVDFL